MVLLFDIGKATVYTCKSNLQIADPNVKTMNACLQLVQADFYFFDVLFNVLNLLL